MFEKIEEKVSRGTKSIGIFGLRKIAEYRACNAEIHNFLHDPL